MKRQLLFLICVLFTVSVFGQEDKTITQRLENKYRHVSYHDTKGGWYSISNGDRRTSKGNKGACDLNGREVIPPIWDDVSFQGTHYEVEKNGFVGIRDLNNRELLPCNKYSSVSWYQKDKYGGYCTVGIDGKCGAIDRNNKEVIPCMFDDIYVFQIQQGNYTEVKLNGKIGIYDVRKQTLVIPCKYDNIYSFSLKKQPFCTVFLDSLAGVYDINMGKEIIPCKYDNISDFQLMERDFCVVEQGGLSGLVTKTGVLMTPCIYTDIYLSLSGDYFVIVKNKKYGLLNKKDCKEVVPCKYGYLKLDHKHNKVAFIQKDAVVRPSYIDENYKYHPSIYEKKGNFGVLDLNTGKEIVPCKYVDIQSADKGLFTFNVGGSLPTSMTNEDYTAKKTEGGKWGLIDATGKELIPAQYDMPIEFKDGVAQVSIDGVSSLLPHPLTGSSLAILNGIARSDVDDNIPQTGKNNSDTFAFIIANESYANVHDAVFAINDGKIFAEYCRKTLGLPENNVKYFENATYGNLVSAIKKVEDIANVYDGDATIIFYYAGLGFSDEQTKERYLLPTDGVLSSVAKTGFRVQEIIERFDGLSTKGTIVIFDAPFTGVDREGKPLEANRGVRLAAKETIEQKNVLVCYGSANNECSYASQKYGHGLFTYGLLKKLKDSKGQCSLGEWIVEATTLVKREALTQFDKTQSPKVVIPIVKNELMKLKF